MNRYPRLVFLGLSLLLTVVSANGCFALFVGATAGVGGYAWYRGTLEKEFNHPVNDVRDKAVKALQALDLLVWEDRSDRLTAILRGEFSDGKDYSIHISAITEKTSRIKIRVGIFGDKIRSEMILNPIQKQLG
jgi:hypothetical protein